MWISGGLLRMPLPSNASLNATILGCFIPDNRTASLLDPSSLDGFYKNANAGMNTNDAKLSASGSVRVISRLQITPLSRANDGTRANEHAGWMCLVHVYTFGSWISLTTYLSCVLLHRTNNARPKDPSPMTLSSEYFSIDQPQVTSRQKSLNLWKWGFAVHLFIIETQRERMGYKFGKANVLWCYFLIIVWRKDTNL